MVEGVVLVDPLYIPGAVEDTFFSQPKPGVLKGAVAPAGVDFNISLFYRPSCAAALKVYVDGAFEFTPKPNINGNCSFIITVLDSTNTRTNGTVIVGVGECRSQLALKSQAPATLQRARRPCPARSRDS